jgi:hypothetical protein
MPPGFICFDSSVGQNIRQNCFLSSVHRVRTLAAQLVLLVKSHVSYNVSLQMKECVFHL